MTFQAYHRARRMGLALNQVRKGDRVDHARNGSGFDSESGFRDVSAKIFGESPTNAQDACLSACRANRFAAWVNDRRR